MSARRGRNEEKGGALVTRDEICEMDEIDEMPLDAVLAATRSSREEGASATLTMRALM